MTVEDAAQALHDLLAPRLGKDLITVGFGNGRSLVVHTRREDASIPKRFKNMNITVCVTRRVNPPVNR